MRVASSLRERVRIEQPVGSNDGYGGKITTWSEVATVFAQVEPIYVAASERNVADQRTAYAGYRVRIRMRNDVTAAMRIIWKARQLSIHSLHEQGDVLSILTYEENL